MDDMVILCKNKEKSKNILSNITIFLEKNFKLINVYIIEGLIVTSTKFIRLKPE